MSKKLLIGLAVVLIGAGAVVVVMQYQDGGAVVASTDIPVFSPNAQAWVPANPQGDNTSFEKVPGDPGPGPLGNLEGYHYAQNESNRVADTEYPLLRPWAREVLRRANQTVLEGGIPFVPNSRCMAAGVPGQLIVPGHPVFYLQTPDQVWIVWQRDSRIRRIYLNQEHSENPLYSVYGESVGHYENGDTLVIDTIGLAPYGPIDRWRTPHTKLLHVVERHRLVNDGQNIVVTFTVDDPGTFTAPWQGMVTFGHGTPPRSERYAESICNENSYDATLEGMAGVIPVPSDDMPDF